MLYIFAKSTLSAGGSRHRAFFVADFLRKAGYDLQLVIAPVYHTETSRLRARFEYVRIMLSLRKGDIVFLQNTIFSTYFIALMYIVKFLFRPTIIFDFDDATWVQNPIAPKALALIADKCIVASHYLATWSWIQGKPIMLMPNLVDYTIAEKYHDHHHGSSVVLGWIGGGPGSMHNLALLVPVFTKLVEHKAPVIFKLVGAETSKELREMFTKTGIATEFVEALDWAKEGEIQKANSSFDVGLCPLVDNESNQGRCSLKVLDYMASSIPVVISPVGENNYFITNGVEGFLPATTEEWIRDLELLIQNTEKRKVMGARAKETLQKKFSYQANVDTYVAFLGLTASNNMR